MNTDAESKHVAERDRLRVAKPVIRSAAARLGAAVLAAGLLLALPVAQAQSKLPTADQDFILAAAQRDLMEANLGALAARKGMRDDVKGFGQMKVKNHRTIRDDLMALASQKGVTLPGSLDANHQARVDKIAGLAGAEFDDAYIVSIIEDHTMEVRDFETEAVETKDADIKSYVDKSLPVTGEHLKRIAAMKKSDARESKAAPATPAATKAADTKSYVDNSTPAGDDPVKRSAALKE